MPRRTPAAYARALIEAARLTARGEKHPAETTRSHYPLTMAWLLETAGVLATAEATTRLEDVDPASLTLHIEGRDIRMSTILETIRFHLDVEYPSLLTTPGPYALLAIKATNLNDRYLVLRLEDADALPDPVRAALHALGDALSRQPSENP